MIRRSSGGFTIIELLIATSIFSVVILVALTGFFQVGKIYYKGISASQTQNTAQTILDDMSTSLQFSSTVVSPTDAGGGRWYMCIGNSRYSYYLGNQVNLASENTSDLSQNRFGLLRDYLPVAGQCGNPFAASNPSQLNNPSELLGSKMRLSKLCLLSVNGAAIDTSGSNCTSASCSSGTPSAPCLNNLWLINLKVAFGDDNILVAPNSQDPSCNGSLSNSQYCSVANLQTVVNRGYGN